MSSSGTTAEEDRWAAVDDYIARTLLADDPVLAETLRSEAQEGMPTINVSAPQGMLLHVLVRVLKAHSVLELGTLAGYSAIWMARALEPGGKVVTLEIDPHHAEVARRNFARAGVSDLVELRLGPALESLAALEREGAGPFDLVFIDADKPSYPDYVRSALRLTRPGSLIVVDNVVRGGRVLETDGTDPVVEGTRGALELLGAERRVLATAIQTVGSKGYDGFAVALVTG
jgi:predicted O-methyltransferase YrrM